MCILSDLTQGMIFEFILRVLILFSIGLIITLGQLGSNSQFLKFFLRYFSVKWKFFCQNPSIFSLVLHFFCLCFLY